ncbi:MAG: beta-ketoacyl synthase N-terminal-like domain-containing protein, partial [Methylovulum sp.]|nr:beta-ketoacyl synthase N-terminal-like domain-containing protein [Methylovulum sp.]
IPLATVSDNNPLAILGAEAEDQTFFTQLAKAGRFRRLAGFWVAGAKIDWAHILNSLPEGQRGHRVHLPPTPLRQIRCWSEPQRPLSSGQQVGHQQRVSVPLASAQPKAVATSLDTAFSPTSALPQSPKNLNLPDKTGIIRELRDIIADALYIAADDLDDHARFIDLGLDSILAVEVTRIINTRFELQLQAARLYDFPSVRDLAAHIRESLGNHANASTLAASPQVAEAKMPIAALTAVVPVSNQTNIPIGKIRTILADALYIDPQELDDHASFADLGLDSILAVEVTNRLNNEFGTTLQATRLYDYPTLAELAKYLTNHTVSDIQLATTADPSPILVFLLGQVGATLAGGNTPTPNTPLDSLDIDPEQAARILNAIENHFGVGLKVADIGGCQNLAAVANLIERRLSGQQSQTSQIAKTVQIAAADIKTPAHDDKRQHTIETDVLGQMRDALAALLWLPADSIETHTPLIDLGLDRIAAQEFTDRLHNLFGTAAPDAAAVLAAPSLAALATAVTAQEKSPVPDICLQMPNRSASVQTASVEIAVTGIACRYPGAADKTAFWELLKNGLSGITRIPSSRWNPSEHMAGLDKPEQREAVQWGGFVEGIDRFDPLFFNLSPREAELMDPQQRLFLEEAWHAFEDAGLSDRRLKGTRCGIFIGVGQGDYSRHLPMDDPAQVTGQLLLGNTASILVSRIAYLLDLAGPAVALDTACSSALVAADMGFRAIRDGSCDFALVGGVNLMTTPQMHVMTAASGMLSPDGQCRTFDDNASGFVPGEGIGLLVLRRLDHALADGDRIYGILQGAGTNQDGKTSGITAPNSNSQERLEREVWQRFSVNPADFGYIEA